MFSYYLKCRKNTETKIERLKRQKNRKILLLSNSTVCGIEKLRFIKEQETSELLSTLAAIKVIF